MKALAIAVSASYSNEDNHLYLLTEQLVRRLTHTLYPAHIGGLYFSLDQSRLWFTPDHGMHHYIINAYDGTVYLFDLGAQYSLLPNSTEGGYIMLSSRDQSLLLSKRDFSEQRMILLPDHFLALSADGQYIIHADQAVTRAGSIFIRPIEDLTHLVLKLDGLQRYDAELETIRWSPDRSRLAFICNYIDLAIMRLDDGVPHVIGSVAYSWRDYRWSPNGEYLGFVVAQETPIPESTSNADEWDTDADEFETDDVLIAGEGSISPLPGEVYIVDVETLTPRYLFSLQRTLETGGQWCWTPDSTAIVYATYEAPFTHLRKVDIHTGAIQELVEPPFHIIRSIAVG